MLVSYKWLQEYVDLSGVTPEDLANQITLTGIEVDQVKKLDAQLKNIVTGHVLECRQHPNAEKLRLCLVDIGEEEPVQIVCGAPNVAAGQKVIVAKPGARLPGGLKIKKAKLRGEVSNGMICSLEELGFESRVVPKEYADGIYVLPEDTPVGIDAIPLLGLDDVVLELDLTANRADCLSMIGVAYETAAIFNQAVQLPKVKENSGNGDRVEDYVSIHVEDPEDAPLYTAKVIKNVTIGPSPLWLQNRLMTSGIRPHNNVVDITNYILLEYGQPLHAFDYDRFGSKEVLVRKAKPGEKIVTLDDVARELTEDDLVITNGKEPVALAGVMGGANSEVTDKTTTILLESAYFNGSTIRKTSKYHGLRSEASSRFEKGVDPNRVRQASERAAELIAELAGGEIVTGMAEFDKLEVKPVEITIELDKLNTFLGTELALDEVTAIIDRLQFTFDVAGETITVHIPSRRWDLAIPEDMYEEIARIYGYDKIPFTLPEGEQTRGRLTDYQKQRHIVRDVLEGAGLNEAITYSLTNEEKYGQFALNQSEPIRLMMPMSEEHAQLRISLIPHLLDAVSYNQARKNNDVFLYEIGSIFIKQGDNVQPKEVEHVAGVLTGLYVNHPWQGEKVPVDFYTVKGILENLFAKLSLDHKITYIKAEIDGMHPGQTAKILLEDEVVGFVGKIHPEREKAYDVKNVFAFELNLEMLLSRELPESTYKPIPRFPAISRDIALIVDQAQEAAELEQVIRKAGGKLLQHVKVFDVYEGEHVAAGKKSIAFTMEFYDPERTLTDEEVNQIHEKIVTELKNFGAELRQ